MSPWTIEAVRYGTYPRTAAAFVLQHAAYGEPDTDQALDYFFYVPRSGGRTVVVDTGFDAAVGQARGRTLLTDPAPVLAGLGADTLVLTHLHYDHIGNLPALGEVPVVAPATELAFWRSPLARHVPFWSHTDPAGLEALAAAEAAGRVTPFAGTTTLAPGITAFEVGGHSPGQVVLLVRTTGGHAVLTSDAVHLYDELKRRRPFAVVADLPAMYAGFDLVDALVAAHDATLVPGHDPLVAERFGPGEVHELAVRIE